MTNLCKKGDRLVISKEQRDLLYERISRDLAGIDAVWTAASSGDLDKAHYLGSVFREELTLFEELTPLMDGCSIEVSTSLRVVRGVLERLRTEAEELDSEIDSRGAADENRELIATCNQLLDSLDRGEPCRSADLAACPEAAMNEADLAQTEILRELLRADQAHPTHGAIVRAVSDRVGLADDVVRQALQALLDLGLLVRSGPEKVAASKGLSLVNRLWRDLSRIY